MFGLHFDVSVGTADIWWIFVFISRGTPRHVMCVLTDHSIYETLEKFEGVGQSLDVPDAYWLLASRPAVKYKCILTSGQQSNGQVHKPKRQPWGFFILEIYILFSMSSFHVLPFGRVRNSWLYTNEKFGPKSDPATPTTWPTIPTCCLVHICTGSSFVSRRNVVDFVSRGACAIGLFLLHRWSESKTQ